MNCHRLRINGKHSLFDFSMEKVAVAGNQILAKGLRLKQPVFLIPLQPLAFTIPYMYTSTNVAMTTLSSTKLHMQASPLFSLC